MSTSKNKIENEPSSDPVDILIYGKGLRIKTVLIVKDLDLFLLILSNGKLIKTKLSVFSRLKNASQDELDKWELRGKGAGIGWRYLDEDLSLRGFIKSTALSTVLHDLQSSDSEEKVII